MLLFIPAIVCWAAR